jgi:hypothetical protein
VHDADAMRRVATDYLDLVARVPVYDLAYRPRFSELPEVVASILAMASAEVHDSAGDAAVAGSKTV